MSKIRGAPSGVYSSARPGGNFLRLCIALASAMPLLAAAAEPAHNTPAQQVDALHAAFGTHHARAVHAKGIVLEGQFTPAADARSLSSAALFTGGVIPVTVRFSDFTGIPDIPDNIGDASPRGMAVKFRMAGGQETDIVTHSFNGFPVATSDDFADLMRAIGASGSDAVKPTALDQFLGSHPIAKTFLTTQKPAPVSYCTISYFGVNSFAYTNAQKQRSFVRYRLVPKTGEEFLDAAALKAKGPNYLSDEIAVRLAAMPMQFDWIAQVAAPGDVIDNPSVAWPETRRTVKLGTITVSRVAPEQSKADKALLFLPSRVPPGIDVADPMIAVRSAAYPISFGARQ
jgi:catalase